MTEINIEKYTFATKKTKAGNIILLAKRKNSSKGYRAVTDEKGIMLFRTKASAHSVAAKIDGLGLEKSSYKFGPKVYE